MGERIEALAQREAPDQEIKVVLEEVDAFDEVFEKAIEEGGGTYGALLEDIHQHPEDYLS
ncbi:MAG: hypothetical protein AAF514_21155 [Verrucomicrobiota bacterium]